MPHTTSALQVPSAGAPFVATTIERRDLRDDDHAALYHALPPGRAKLWLNRMDHAAIYLFIGRP